MNAIFEPQEAVLASDRYAALFSAVTATSALCVVALLQLWS